MSTVTALVSAYYAAPFLEERLHNLQQLKPMPEIIIVCQKDSEESNIVRKLNNLPVCTKNIPTLYTAWNIGLAWAFGEYITSANCDDKFYNWGLNAMSSYLDAHPDIDLVYGNCDMRVGDEIHEWKRGDSYLEHGINRIGAMPLWRRSLHDRFGLFDETMTVSGDYDFWLRCVRGGAKIAHIDETVGLYWKRPDSLEHRNKAQMKAENARIEA